MFSNKFTQLSKFREIRDLIHKSIWSHNYHYSTNDKIPQTISEKIIQINQIDPEKLKMMQQICQNTEINKLSLIHKITQSNLSDQKLQIIMDLILNKEVNLYPSGIQYMTECFVFGWAIIICLFICAYILDYFDFFIKTQKNK